MRAMRMKRMRMMRKMTMLRFIVKVGRLASVVVRRDVVQRDVVRRDVVRRDVVLEICQFLSFQTSNDGRG
jgi:hypothetical protein